MKSRKKRDELLEKRTTKTTENGKTEKRKVDITQHDIIENGKTEILYIKENQSPYYRNLEMLAKKVAKVNNGYRFIWFNNGKLFVKKDEKAKTIRIRNENDLKTLFGADELRKGKRTGTSPRENQPN